MNLAVAYLRVSTEKQETEAQKRAIEEFARNHGFSVIWFTDEAVSGGVKARERPGFSAMLRFLESNPMIRDIIVFELSRLGRDYDDLKDVLHEFSSKGYRLWIVTLPTWNQIVDMIKSENNPLLQLLYKLLADILVSVMAFASAQERVLISIRTRAGIARARAEGKHVGRPPYPLPLDRIRMLLRQGKSIKDIWRLLKEKGEICREVKGVRKCMSYETFRRKLHELRIV